MNQQKQVKDLIFISTMPYKGTVSLYGGQSRLGPIKYSMTAIIHQEVFEFMFKSQLHPEIIDWLQDHCNWNYNIFTKLLNPFGNYVHLIFDDVQAVIEFKMRFDVEKP